ncbi:hypothetical protein JTB14_033140 [Gonioctena quinquepunctata]|nr:hypothetical protein JTB14_033140 [Gonioctena quinquepunctata]
MSEEIRKNVPPEIDKPEGADTRHEGQGNAPPAPNEDEKQEAKSEQVHTGLEFQLGKNNVLLDTDSTQWNVIQNVIQSGNVNTVTHENSENEEDKKGKQDIVESGSPDTPQFLDCISPWETPNMPTPIFHIGAGSRLGEIQQLNVEKSIISVVTNIEDDEILTLEKSNVENPSGPSEVEKTGEYSETESSSKSVHTRPRPMRRSCRIVLADGEGKYKRKRMSPEEANEKSTKRQIRLEPQGKQKTERCDCGEIPPKHGYYTKFDDYKINVKCTGSRLQTETSVGHKLITVAEKLKERNARSIEKFKSDYEKENEIQLKKANEKEERMEVNQSQEGKEEKAKDKGNAPTKDEDFYITLENADKMDLEIKMKKAREEREKREKLKEIRKMQDEKDEKEKQQKKEKEKEIQIKSKNKIKNQEKRIPVTNKEQEENSQEDDNQERISDRDSDWEIERTLNNRKYKNYSPNGEAVQRAQQGGNDLRFDITRAARKWAKITEDKLRKRHKEEGIDVPYEVIYGGKLEALFKYYQRKLTDKHQQEFRNFRDQLMILTSDLEEENQEPRKKQVERTMTKPKPKPAIKCSEEEIKRKKLVAEFIQSFSLIRSRMLSFKCSILLCLLLISFMLVYESFSAPMFLPNRRGCQEGEKYIFGRCRMVSMNRRYASYID